MRKRIVASGRVQGVFFRDTVRNAAEREGVSGWVRNNRDGTVEAVFEGTPDAVERVLAASREGPPGARVEAVEVHDEPEEGIEDFRVR